MKNSFENPLLGKKTLEHLAELGRIDIGDKGQETSDKEEKLLKDLQKILEYFDELKEVDTENIEPMAGGTIGKNVFREDEKGENGQTKNENLVEQFPKKQNGYLKVPPVFE